MAVKFSILNELINLSGDEYFPVVHDYENFIVSLSNIKASIYKADVGLGNVDNTSDAAKPVSQATQIALNNKADINHDHLISIIPGYDSNHSLAHTQPFPIQGYN
jgi:hypothetical protein